MALIGTIGGSNAGFACKIALDVGEIWCSAEPVIVSLIDNDAAGAAPDSP